MDNNEVRLHGTVKRNAECVTERGSRILDFALEVWSDKNSRLDVFDCRTTDGSAAMEELEGFVTEGEELEVEGHLEKSTKSERQRMAGGVMVEVRNTSIVVYVDDVIEEED